MVVQLAVKLEQSAIGTPRFVLKVEVLGVFPHHLLHHWLVACHLITLLLIVTIASYRVLVKALARFRELLLMRL